MGSQKSNRHQLRFVGRRQNTPENATHLKAQAIDCSQKRFRVCFGVLLGERRAPENADSRNNRLPFTPNFLQINPLPFFVLFLYLFLLFLREFVAAPIFFCNSHALLGESRGYCPKTKQEWPDSGSTLENIFCNFYEINSSQDCFLHCKNFGVDGISVFGCIVLSGVFCLGHT